jgi:CubicO group peptidase (beta-lactamase class C family)
MPDKAMAARLDSVIDRALGEKKIVGTVVLVAQDGKVVYHRAAGLADREARRPVREDDLFRLASMTKPIVSAAALRLSEQGKLRLEDPITRWLPTFRPKLPNGSTPTITVKHLLTHTAGLNYGFLEKAGGPYHKLKVSDGLDNPDISLEENLRRLADALLLFAPGTSWNYSLATDVLGAVVAQAGGADLPTVVQRLITGPLGMKETAFTVTRPARLATPYGDGTPQPKRMTHLYPLPFGEGTVLYSPARAFNRRAYASGGAGMVGTAQDYLAFLEAIRTGGGPILRAATVRQMTSNVIGNIPVNAAGPGWGWGLGFAILKSPAQAKTPMNIGSYQWGGAYGNHFWVDPKAKLTVVELTNTAVAGMTGAFPDAITKAVYG